MCDIHVKTVSLVFGRPEGTAQVVRTKKVISTGYGLLVFQISHTFVEYCNCSVLHVSSDAFSFPIVIILFPHRLTVEGSMLISPAEAIPLRPAERCSVGNGSQEHTGIVTAHTLCVGGR